MPSKYSFMSGRIFSGAETKYLSKSDLDNRGLLINLTKLEIWWQEVPNVVNSAVK